MDRKSKQKIGYAAIGLLVLLISAGILCKCRIRYEERLRERQRQELGVIYPELQEELWENFEYYQEKSVSADISFFMGMLLLMVLFGTVFYLLYRYERKAWENRMQEELEWLYEQLQRYLHGDFQLILQTDAAQNPSEAWLGIHEKITELGYYFSDLKMRLKEEENSTKALITDISHQLKTPVASIRMCQELSASNDLTIEERAEFQATEAREIQKLEMLLDELVKLSRLENHMIQLNPVMTGLKQTITEAVSQVFMKAYEKQIDVSVEMEQDVQVVHDRKWTVEALVNILDNAVKYSGNGSGITIRVQCLQNHVLAEVEDEGIGIPEEEQHKIFRRFYRGITAREKVKDGAGVGLYLARSIIEQQGGTILAKRRAEQGTRFIVMFPLN